MREDQVMQAILRFARGGSGATVVARTSALREDLPVVGEGQVAETWSDTATEIARGWRRLGGEFTRADVEEFVDVGPRQVRRVLDELVDAGYLDVACDGDGRAKVYQPQPSSQPGAGEVELPERDAAVASSDAPGGDAHSEYYTWNVRVWEGVTPPDARRTPRAPQPTGAPPAPQVAEAGPPAD